MADSVSVSSTAGQPLTWASATFNWSSVNAGKAFNSLASLAYTLSIGETVGFAEVAGKQTSKVWFESFGTADALARQVGKALAESVTVGDKTRFDASKGIFELVTFLETPAKSVTKPFQEAFVTSDKYALSFTKATAESLAMPDVLRRDQTLQSFETIGVGERLGKSVIKPIRENFSASDKYALGFTKAASETLGVGEALRRDQTLRLSESLSVGELLAKLATKSVSESLKTTDAIRFDATKRWVESATFQEILAKNTTLPKSESFQVSEFSNRGIGKNAYESFGLADRAFKDVALAVFETLGITDTYVDNIAYILRVCEHLRFDEALGKDFTRPLSDSFGITDARFAQVSKSFSEAMTISEALKRAQTIAKTENISMSDALAKAVTLPKGEAFGVGDSIRKSTTKSISESVRVAEKIEKLSQKLLLEAMSLGEKLEKRPTLNASESLNIAETKFEKVVTLAIHEIVGVMELFGRSVGYHLYVNEGMHVTDALKKASKLSIAEALGIYDEYRRHANAIMSDMIVSTEPLTMATFMQVVDSGRAPGFAPFRDFIPGDYEYQNAIFRAVLKSTTSDRAKLKEMKVTVDVPDVFDRGSVTIAAADASTGARVNFTRSFHITPEITVTLKGGTVIAIPKVLNSDDGGFTLVLETQSGTRVGGTVSWSAQGY